MTNAQMTDLMELIERGFEQGGRMSSDSERSELSDAVETACRLEEAGADGISLTGDDVTNLGKSILKTERAFNLAAGLNNADDRLPEFFYSEPLPPHNTVVDFTPEEIDSFWNF